MTRLVQSRPNVQRPPIPVLMTGLAKRSPWRPVGEDVEGTLPHRPVMADEVLDALGDVSDGIVIDTTVGTGGHARALLESNPGATLIGIDRDPEALDLAESRLSPWADRIELVRADYRDLPRLVLERGWWPIRGILADLGISSAQLDDPERGFSFQRSGPLDMRMDRSGGRTAAELLATLPEDELATILREYGEERHARRIARAIVAQRERSSLETTTELAELVKRTVPAGRHPIHPATRTFQALRIAVNDELSGLREFVVGAGRLLAPGGRLVVIAFHSLEDRPVKRAMRYLEQDCVCPPKLVKCVCDKYAEAMVMTPRPRRPEDDEIEDNPRSRSARLRALVRR